MKFKSSKLSALALATAMLAGGSALALAATDTSNTAQSPGVTYHTPNLEMEKNLHKYSTGVANWEESQYLPYTAAEAHLYHYYALLKHGEPMPLTVKGGLDVSKIMVDNVIPGKKISLYDVMRDRASIQSYVVMNKKGEILAEDYWNGTTVDTKNHIMSAHKSFSSMLAAIAEREGFLKLSDPIGKYVPEFKGTAWEKVTIQNFLDMTGGVDLLPRSRDGYHNWGMPADEYGWDSSQGTVLGYNGLREKNGKLVPPADAQGNLETFSDYLKVFALQVEPFAEPGDAYLYRDINTDIFAVAIVRASGMTYAEFMQKYLWSKGGFNSDMTLFVNQARENAAAGSMDCTARDFAIGGYLMVNGGKNWKGEQVLPPSFVKSVYEGDAEVKAAWPKRSYEASALADAFYKNQWRTFVTPGSGRVVSTAIGANGQFLAFDHKTGNIVATQSTFRVVVGKAPATVFLFDVINTIFDELDKQNI